MDGFLEFISNNGLVSSLIASAILGGLGWIWSKRRDRRDSDSIYRFMLNSKSNTAFNFRSTTAIASHTKLAEERVESLCSRHPKIRRNEKEKASWTLAD